MNYNQIQGGSHTDERGTLSFVNDFDMTCIKRFYVITHQQTSIIRAWQAHKKESKWFYVISGSFKIALVQPDNWDKPSKDLAVTYITMNENNSSVLHIPAGYANGIQALEKNAKLMVFSNFTIEEAATDNIKFETDYWHF